MAGDPYGWRDHITTGSPISNEIALIAAENIDAFGSSDASAAAEVFPARATEGGYLSDITLGARDAQDVLTFVGAGRDPATALDRDVLAVHTAAHAYTHDQILLATTGAVDPGTALAQAGNITAAVDTADFRTAMHAYDNADAAASALYTSMSAVAGVPIGGAVELATGALPGWVGDGLSTAVDLAVEGFEPADTAGQRGQELRDSVAGRHYLDMDHLLVSTYQQAGGLPVDTPDLDAVIDHTGQVASLESFRDAQPDPDVVSGEDKPREALGQIAGHGPAGGEPAEWRAALNDYHRLTDVARLDPDYADPEPRTPLDPALAERAGHSGHALPPLAPPSMGFPSDSSTPVPVR